MFSRLALRCGSFGAIARVPPHTSSLIAVRALSKEVATESSVDKAHALFNSPDRDTKNFPDKTMAEEPGKVRLGFIPDEWFQAFYAKTGVTGPYLFGGGLVTYLLSKEILVVDHSFTELCSFWIAFGLLVNKAGPTVSRFLDQKRASFEEKMYVEPTKEAQKDALQFIADAEKAIWCQEGQKHLYEAKRENVDLQLEALYRQRLHEVHQEVKKRLDYQLDLQNAKRSFEQEHMVNWIVDNVTKGITPQQEKDAISKCIADLKGLAVKA